MSSGSMENTLLNGYALLAFLYAGIVAGLVHDLTGLLLSAIHRRLLGFLIDLMLVLALGVLTGGVFYLVTGGALRLYGLILMLLGAMLSRKVFGLPRLRICKRIVKRT